MEKWLQKDMSVKLLSVAIAVILWFQVMSEENPSIQKPFMKVPVETVNLTKEQVLLDWQPRAVDLTIKGPRNLLGRIAKEDIKITLDLSGLKEGHSTLPLDVEVPRGLSVVEMVPSIATVVVDTMAEKTVKVVIDVKGTPAEDYEALDPVIDVQEVKAMGPKTKLTMVENALGTVDISGAAGEWEAMAALIAVGSGKEQEDITLEPDTVGVKVPMRQLPPSKIVEVTANVTGVPAGGCKVSSASSQPGTVKVRASQGVLDRLNSLRTEQVSIEGREAGVMTRQVGLALPSGVFSVEPARVTVTVVIVKDIVNRDMVIPVTLRNASTDLTWSISPAECTLSISGSGEDMEKLSANVGAFVDVGSLEEGTHTLEVKASLPDGLEVTGIRPSTVEVTLTKQQ